MRKTNIFNYIPISMEWTWCKQPLHPRPNASFVGNNLAVNRSSAPTPWDDKRQRCPISWNPIKKLKYILLLHDLISTLLTFIDFISCTLYIILFPSTNISTILLSTKSFSEFITISLDILCWEYVIETLATIQRGWLCNQKTTYIPLVDKTERFWGFLWQCMQSTQLVETQHTNLSPHPYDNEALGVWHDPARITKYFSKKKKFNNERYEIYYKRRNIFTEKIRNKSCKCKIYYCHLCSKDKDISRSHITIQGDHQVSTWLILESLSIGSDNCSERSLYPVPNFQHPHTKLTDVSFTRYQNWHDKDGKLIHKAEYILMYGDISFGYKSC